jgi:acetylornithine/N-succinyldiaminopimelate aminotransferase
MDTIKTEDRFMAPFLNKTQLSIERGKGVYVWDENGKRYLDFTAGWGVTSIGHSNPVIIRALCGQAKKIIQNPNSGTTYSPARARLLSLMSKILPRGLTRIFFASSGAEANDAVIKLARKVSGRMNVVSMEQSFHGRTISTASATGQAVHREKFNPLMPNYLFVPYNDVQALSHAITRDVAAVILEPVQGEGGVIVPAPDYLAKASALCKKNNAFLIVDEVQTGFCRTGPMFASNQRGVTIDFLTMAKGIAGGFPFGAFAVREAIARKFEKGDHGGTFCGNPLGCAVSYSVIKYLVDNNISAHVRAIGAETLAEFARWKRESFGEEITDVRGKGLLIAMQVARDEFADEVKMECLDKGMILNITHGNIIRLFPALTITSTEMKQGLTILRAAVEKAARNRKTIFARTVSFIPSRSARTRNGEHSEGRSGLKRR